MPIGKNSINRVQSVAKTGAAPITSTAPDMENSTVLAEEKKPAKKRTTAPKTAAPKASAPKAAPAKAAEPASEVKKAVKAAKKETGILHIAIGDPMPVYLL